MVAGNQNGFYGSGRVSHKIARAYSNAYDGKVFNSGFRELNFSATSGLNKSWGYSELSVSSFDQSVGLIEGERDSNGNFIRVKDDNGSEVETTVTDEELNSYTLFVPRQNIHHVRISNVTNLYTNNSRVQLNFGYQRNQRKEFGSVLNENEAELFFDLHTVNYNVIYFLPQKNKWQLSTGVSGMAQQNKNRGEEFIIPEYQLFDWGVFAFIKRPIGNVDIAGGIRFDQRLLTIDPLLLDNVEKFKQVDLNFSNVSASAGITYEFNSKLTAKLNLAHGFRAPNISELASHGKHEGTQRYEYGSYALDPETSWQADASILLNSQHISAEISLFQNLIDNYIFTQKLKGADGMDSIPDPTDPAPAYRYVQGKALLHGGEITIDIHPHPLDWLHIENSFSLVQATNQTQQGNDSARYLPFIPAPRLQSEIRANLKNIGNTFTQTFFKIEYTYLWKQERVLLENQTETKTPAYGLWNLGMGTRVVHRKEEIFTLHFSVTNLFDKAYQSHLSRLKYAPENPASGRTGVFNMGRNFSVKIMVPLTFKKSVKG
jgi:iron complex outermembrane receptor protein